MRKNQLLLSGGILVLSLFLISTLSVAAQGSPTASIAQSSSNRTAPPSAAAVSAQLMVPQIEIAPLSGVSGYPIGIFGADFGASQGTVTILGASATILEWTPTFIRAEIPQVSDGIGNLTVTTAGAQSFSQSFEVYTIDPNFQRPSTNRFTNIMRGKTPVVQNVENGFCYQQPGNAYRQPTEFLTNFDCGFSGIIGDGEVVVGIPNGGSTVMAVDLAQTLSGIYYFQFFGYPSWYANWDIAPKAYTIQVSANSTNGFNGSWLTVHAESNNNRGTRLHKIDVPAGGHHWIRMNMSAGSNQPRAKFKELRLYESTNAATSDLDMITVYGDSITEGAFYHIGATGLSQQISSKIGSADEPIFAPFGLSGQNATGLIEQANIDYDIFDAFATDNMGSMARYWGIALGNNDTGEADNELGVPGSHVEEFDERVEAMVQLMISQNKVPILARLPDTNENISTDVLATKKKLLGDIDQIAADYRLIPGPDLYTLMRLNIERDNASWYWPGDPYHQNWTGRLKIIEAWAEAFNQGTNRAAFVAGTQPPGIVTQVGPVGNVASQTPTYVWQPKAAATGYQVLLYRPDTQTVIWTKNVDASTHCNATECAYQPTSTSSLTPAPYVWLIRAFNPAGFGQWSLYVP